MTSILLLKETIYYNSFRCKYFFSKKYFLSFFFVLLHFWNLDSILIIFKRKMTLIADRFLNLRTLKNVVRYMFKKSGLIGPFDK